MDKRPVIEQVKSGFKIAGAILVSFAAAVCFLIGYRDVVTPEKQHATLGWAILVAVTVTLLFTVKVWATWFCGVASYLAVRSTFLIFFAHKGRLSVPTAIGITASLWFIAMLSIRFYEKRRFSKFDQLAITTAAICIFWGFARLGTVGENAILLPFLTGIPLLLVSASEKPLKHALRSFSSKTVAPSP